jgi:hypothetical protein
MDAPKRVRDKETDLALLSLINLSIQTLSMTTERPRFSGMWRRSSPGRCAVIRYGCRRQVLQQRKKRQSGAFGFPWLAKYTRTWHHGQVRDITWPKTHRTMNRKLEIPEAVLCIIQTHIMRIRLGLGSRNVLLWLHHSHERS